MAKRQHPIFTIGYEGASVAAFVAALREAGVALVLDIRAAPVSRKRDSPKRPSPSISQRQGSATAICADWAHRNRGARLRALETMTRLSAFFAIISKSLKRCSTSARL